MRLRHFALSLLTEPLSAPLSTVIPRRSLWPRKSAEPSSSSNSRICNQPEPVSLPESHVCAWHLFFALPVSVGFGSVNIPRALGRRVICVPVVLRCGRARGFSCSGIGVSRCVVWRFLAVSGQSERFSFLSPVREDTNCAPGREGEVKVRKKRRKKKVR